MAVTTDNAHNAFNNPELGLRRPLLHGSSLRLIYQIRARVSRGFLGTSCISARVPVMDGLKGVALPATVRR
jgi:hypothetical protein